MTIFNNCISIGAFTYIDLSGVTCPLHRDLLFRFLMKLFNTTNMDFMRDCRQYFDVKLPSILWSDRVRRFEKKFAECDNIFFAKFQSLFDSLYLSLS